MKITRAVAGLVLLILVLGTSAFPHCPCALSDNQKPCSHNSIQKGKSYSAVNDDLRYKQTYGDSIATYSPANSLYDSSNSNYGSQAYEASPCAGTSSTSAFAYNAGAANNYGSYNTVGQSVGRMDAVPMQNGYRSGSLNGATFEFDGGHNYASRSRSFAANPADKSFATYGTSSSHAASSHPTSTMNLAASLPYSNAISSASAASSASSYSVPMHSSSSSYPQTVSPAYPGAFSYRDASSANQAPASQLTYSASSAQTYPSSATASSYATTASSPSYSSAASAAYSASAALSSHSAAPSRNSVADVSSLYPDSALSATSSFSNAASAAYSEPVVSTHLPYANSATNSFSPYTSETLYSESSPYSSSGLTYKSKYSSKQSDVAAGRESYVAAAQNPILTSIDYNVPATFESHSISAEPYSLPCLAHLESSQGLYQTAHPYKSAYKPTIALGSQYLSGGYGDNFSQVGNSLNLANSPYTPTCYN